MIARDEEHNLPRALSSVREVADEIILTDTGSTDRTVSIAREFGAKTFRFPWCDDFSAARNFCLDQANGTWIFWLDADEELLKSSAPALMEATAQDGVLAYHILRQDLVDPNRPDRYTEMWQLRLFRNRPDLRFAGRCHPHFQPSIESIAEKENLEIGVSTVAIRHYGYIGELKEAKLQRAASLLELELEDQPDQLYYLIEYGRTLLQLRDRKGHEILARATEKVLERREDKSPPTPLVAALFEYLLQIPRKQLPCDLTPEQVCELALRWFPKGAPLLWIMAGQAFQKGQFERAEILLKELVRMREKQDYDHHISFDPRIIGDDAVLNLGACLFRQAKLAEAEECFRKLLESGERSNEARKNLNAIKKARYRASRTVKRKKKQRKKRKKRN